jgi:hypothetical protein
MHSVRPKAIILAIAAVATALTSFSGGWIGHDLFDRRASRTVTQIVSDLARLNGVAEKTARGVEILSERTERMLDATESPAMPGLKVASWQNRIVKTIDMTLAPDTDPKLMRQFLVPPDWRPEPEADPEATLPVPWPKLWTIDRGQNFSPETAFYNLVGMANWIRDNGEAAEISPYATFLLGRIREYLVASRDGGQLVTYRFPTRWFDKTVATGWVSSLGNASLIMASLYYFKQTGDARFMKLATELVQGLRTLDGTDPKWLAHIDDAQFIWFEEMPLDGPKKAHVLNGHIATVFALAEYCQVTGDADACLMARAGVATAKRYVMAYRVPGHVNRYSLYAETNPDYGPTRTVNEQRGLFALTGDPFFADMAATFLSDMPHDLP